MMDFLPQLPKSDLDDRSFEDLVDEALLRIPRYCPEWTNFNPSDPGVTMIELFAWMTEQMLQRFNQVPRRNYVAFLELLGVRLQPPMPARTDLTFYLNTKLAEPYTISANTEVATLRTETEAAIVFSTDQDLTIDTPVLRHFLTAQTPEDQPQTLQDCFTNRWTQAIDGTWSGAEQSLFEEQPQPGNCFYLVLDPRESLQGNVLSITIRGEAATATGINPHSPPRRWEAWDGESWQPILRAEADDQTQGFSFSQLSQQRPNAVQTADVILHLPKSLPVANFQTYRGHWLRCVCLTTNGEKPEYQRSPRVLGLSVQTIGGTVAASQCSRIEDEILGISDGTAGQTFQLFGVPVMARTAEEYIQVTPPNSLPQIWQEVSDFSESSAHDRHYVIDSVTGTVQFGPLVREPMQLRQEMQERSRIQSLQREGTTASTVMEPLERQYGAIPPRGSTIRMVAYRTGGGKNGNVQRGTLTVLKTAIPYVASVTNYEPAQNGTDAESLEHAAIRVPKLLRSRDRAVTPEDFEILTLQAGSVARCRCLPASQAQDAGTVRLLIVPQVNLAANDTILGMHPDQLAITESLKEQVLSYLDERKLLGVQVQLLSPDYVGISVRVEVGVDPIYRNPQARESILQQLRQALYRFLNPVVGGIDGMGWEFGRPVYPSDIVALFQQVQGVRYLGAVQLFELRCQEGNWIRNPSPQSVIDPGELGLICSWNDRQLRANHSINLIV